ncbi:prepilin-type N-terminal cleavage/methylation domain-containing protein [Chitinilyticum piscinae]|uniref:PilW family protein n=1 Tax=Chitinilyticum piscinae TaxID=2866724 RepID=A0A8J7FL11_9NEIS|nr:prepilin-type N-terminal cleavage/methylation domain-containing protein [Chitinilyticum piscinae]MBE9609747.1 PilW family protein [Chitinilyticum piscinae]
MKHSKHSGFTLIELMVAMAIAMIALLAIAKVYIQTRQTFNLQAMQNRVAEDGRFAMAMLQRAVSQAGFRPNPATALPANHLASTGAGAFSVRFTADGTNQMSCNGSVAPAGDTTLQIARSGSRLQCGSVDWIAPNNGGSGTEVADFSVQYGIDTNDNDALGNPRTPAEYGCGADVGSMKARDCVANRYVSNLAGITADQVVAVKLCLILRTEKTAPQLEKGAAVTDCSGNALNGSQTDRRLYRTFNSTVLVRNR